MANTQGIGYVTKQVALGSVVDGVAMKAAIYVATATIDGSVAAYTATGEVTGTGYTAGGVSVTNGNTAGLTGATTFWTPSASISYGTVTLATSFDAVMLYDTGAANRNVGVFTFPAQTVNAAPFSLLMPTNDATTGLIRLT